MNLELQESAPCYRIHATDLFDDPAFREWLNRRVGKGLATWHAGGEPHDFSDVFVVYDHGEGSDSSDCEDTGMPEHCWRLIDEFCRARRIDYAVLWLLNYGP